MRVCVTKASAKNLERKDLSMRLRRPMSYRPHTYIYANKSEAQLSLYCARSVAMVTSCGDAETVETAEAVEAA